MTHISQVVLRRETKLEDKSRIVRAAANKGDAEAQLYCANTYFKGIGVRQDDKEAVMWYTRSADGGNATAQCWLGDWYLGAGNRDSASALQWYLLASDQGHADAQYKLGGMYRRGQGVRKSTVVALMYYNLADANIHEDATIERNRLPEVENMTRAEVREANALAKECGVTSLPVGTFETLQGSQPKPSWATLWDNFRKRKGRAIK